MVASKKDKNKLTVNTASVMSRPPSSSMQSHQSQVRIDIIPSYLFYNGFY